MNMQYARAVGEHESAYRAEIRPMPLSVTCLHRDVEVSARLRREEFGTA